MRLNGVVAWPAKCTVILQALLGKENYAKGVVVKATDEGDIANDVYTVKL